MDSFHYLHLWVSADTDADTKILDKEFHPIKLGDVGLVFQDWYKDDFFKTFPVFICTDRLKSLLVYEGFQNLKFTAVDRVKSGHDFDHNYPGAELGKFWLFETTGKCGIDDFALWQGLYLVVSQNGLDFLRDNGVTHAESDQIIGDFESYFASDRKNFWM